MSGLRQILNTSDQNTLVLSDELTKGTEVVSATSIFASTVLSLSKRGTKFLFTTHLTEVAKLPEISSCPLIAICHLSVKIHENHIVFERKLLPGPCDELYGLEVARATGIDLEVLELAFKIRNKLTMAGSTQLEKGDRSSKLKKSRYNAKKILDACEVCGHKPKGRELHLDTHHIHFQNTADSRGFIGHFHKNALGNLVTLCKRCHDDLHQDKIRVHG
jgi:DNA mismatch repair ATPase MutS